MLLCTGDWSNGGEILHGCGLFFWLGEVIEYILLSYLLIHNAFSSNGTGGNPDLELGGRGRGV
jgi:hypothetical protein